MRMAVATALAVGGVMLATTSAQAAPDHRTPAALEDIGHVIGVRHPGMLTLGQIDGNGGYPFVLLMHMHWSAWRDTYARGTGTLVVAPLDVGFSYKYHVTVKLSHVITRYGRRYYEYMYIIGGPRSIPKPRFHINRHWRWAWRGFPDWVGAS